MRKVAAALLCATLISGCAFGTTKVPIAYDASQVKPGLLSEAAPRRIALGEITDARADPTRIGDKRNGYGQTLGALVPTASVPEIVRGALKATLEKNGHTVADDGDLVLDAKIEKFWADYKTGLVTVEYFGTTDVGLTLKDKATQSVLFAETFNGYHSMKTGGGFGPIGQVLNEALSDLGKDISFSEELKEALEPAPAPVAAPSAPSAAPLEETAGF